MQSTGCRGCFLFDLPTMHNKSTHFSKMHTHCYISIIHKCISEWRWVFWFGKSLLNYLWWNTAKRSLSEVCTEEPVTVKGFALQQSSYGKQAIGSAPLINDQPYRTDSREFLSVWIPCHGSISQLQGDLSARKEFRSLYSPKMMF